MAKVIFGFKSNGVAGGFVLANFLRRLVRVGANFNPSLGGHDDSFTESAGRQSDA